LSRRYTLYQIFLVDLDYKKCYHKKASNKTFQHRLLKDEKFLLTGDIKDGTILKVRQVKTPQRYQVEYEDIF